MEQPRVIDATFSDWRTVKGRKMLQLIFEVPLEKQTEVLTMLGAPDPANPKWCAVAVLDLGRSSTEERRTSNSDVAGSTPAVPAKQRRPFDSLPLSQQAAIRCNDAEFRGCIGAANSEDAASFVRSYCSIPTRAYLDNPEYQGAISLWNELEARYQSYLTTQKYGEMVR